MGQNTICGRNPITLLVDLLQSLYADAPTEQQPKFTFVRYEQSSRCESGRDSSVSYVSGVLRLA
jgi:predicted class III extradiol MEMO1 family dioxygenase